MSLVCQSDKSTFACCTARDKEYYTKDDEEHDPIQRKSHKALYEHVTRSSEKTKSFATASSLYELESYRSFRTEP